MNDRKEVLGVIGGLGPIATAHFMELVIRMTEAETDQEHLDMIVYSFPSIPDRTGYILDNTQPSPLPPMIAIGEKLAQQGADHIAIPCTSGFSPHGRQASGSRSPCRRCPSHSQESDSEKNDNEEYSEQDCTEK